MRARPASLRVTGGETRQWDPTDRIRHQDGLAERASGMPRWHAPLVSHSAVSRSELPANPSVNCANSLALRLVGSRLGRSFDS